LDQAMVSKSGRFIIDVLQIGEGGGAAQITALNELAGIIVLQMLLG